MNSKKMLISGLIFIIITLTFFSFRIKMRFFPDPNSLNFSILKKELFGVSQVLAQDTKASYPIHPGFPINYYEWTDRTGVTIADINNDGSNELLLPTYNKYEKYGKINAWDAFGKTLSGFPINIGDWSVRGWLTLGDLNRDGDLEIAVGLNSPSPGIGAKVAIYNPNGTLFWSKNTACAVLTLYCSISGIMMSDIDNDSYLEVIVGTTNRILTTSDPANYVPNLYIWEHNGELKTGWPSEDDHNTAIIGQMAVGDLNGDSYPDIVTGRDYNRLFAFNRSGGNLGGWPHYVWYPFDVNDWTDDQIEFPRSSPALADLNQDGSLEYIVPGHRREAYSSTYTYPELLIYNANASRFSGWELPATGRSLGWVSNTTKMIEAPAIADLNGDGKPEIIHATQDGYVRAYTAEKQKLWEYNYYLGRQVHTSEVAIGDVDGDGNNEVVFGTFWIDMVTKGGVGIIILNHDGTENSKIVLNSVGISNTPALGDLDGDGLIEIAAATYDGSVYVWDTPGQALPERMPWPMARHDLQRSGLYKDLSPNFSQSYKKASLSSANFGEIITYNIRLIRSGALLDNEIVVLTDFVPSGMTYVSNSLTASAGIVDASSAPILKWTGSGSLFDNNQVTITYQARVTTNLPTALKNTAYLNAGSAGEYQFSSTVIANGFKFYLPLIRR